MVVVDTEPTLELTLMSVADLTAALLRVEHRFVDVRIDAIHFEIVLPVPLLIDGLHLFRVLFAPLPLVFRATFPKRDLIRSSPRLRLRSVPLFFRLWHGYAVGTV